jgi:putative hydrolase of the HAD superfamily
MVVTSNPAGMSTDVVLFDLDDTLYPYAPCNRAGKQEAWRTALDLGYDLDREAFESLYQEGRRETKRELAGTASAHERFLYFKRAIQIHTGTHKSEHALELGEAYWDAYVHEMELYDDVEPVLQELQAADHTVGIVTNLTTRIQLEKIHHLGIEPYVDLLLTSEETGREKPSGVMFTDPIAQLDARPSEATFVGDDPVADVEGANAVGL